MSIMTHKISCAAGGGVGDVLGEIRGRTLAMCLVGLVMGASIIRSAEPTTRNGVVVLLDGRVFQGSLLEVPGGYRIDRQGGFVVIPFDQIRLTAETLPNAYELLRKSIKEP